jgi:hypothetical protein
MNMALASTKIDTKIKHRILEFDLYKFKSAVCIRFRKAVAYFDGDPECH